jgi:hypothetical protein
MEHYLLLEHWSSIIRKFKDEEAPNGYEAEKLALFILDYVRYTRFRQYNLFTQKRGEEFERMVDQVERAELSVDMLRRFIEDDERWQTTLELADE